MREAGGTRRDFMRTIGMGAAAMALPGGEGSERVAPLVVDPEPRFDLSPYLFMQFMEPLGPFKNNFAFWHPIFTPSSAAPQLQNPRDSATIPAVLL